MRVASLSKSRTRTCSNRRTKSNWQMHSLIVHLVGHTVDEAQKSREWLLQRCCILSAVRRCTQGAKIDYGSLIEMIIGL